MNKKLLITAFEPFGGETTNASQEAVFALPDRIGDWEIHKITIPVVLAKPPRLLLTLPRAVLSMQCYVLDKRQVGRLSHRRCSP